MVETIVSKLRQGASKLNQVKKAELRDCKTVEEFEAVALKHGYKKGWGYYQWQLRNKKK